MISLEDNPEPEPEPEVDPVSSPWPPPSDIRTSVCAVCGTSIFWQDCPTGGWWIHRQHPEDGHDGKVISALEANPESTHHYDRYIDDKFLEIFDNEDQNGALARIVTEGLSRNDNGVQHLDPPTSWHEWWKRAKGAES